MLSLNSTLKLIYRNPVTFFCVHVASTPISMTYYQLSVASGNRAVNVVVEGKRLPLNGGGSGLSSSGTTKTSVGLNITFEVSFIAYVLGKLVKPKFYTEVQYSAVLDQNKLGIPFSLKNLY
ncbi:hypothetical protein AMTRI_Chr09g18320 [Amborella trichopoda]